MWFVVDPGGDVSDGAGGDDVDNFPGGGVDDAYYVTLGNRFRVSEVYGIKTLFVDVGGLEPALFS